MSCSGKEIRSIWLYCLLIVLILFSWLSIVSKKVYNIIFIIFKLQFRRSNSLQHNDEQSRGPKICGKIIAKKPEFTSLNIFDPSEEMLLPYAFIDYGGKIEVEIHVANVTRSPDTDLRFRIAFMSYYRELKCTFSLPNFYFNSEHLFVYYIQHARIYYLIHGS